MNYRNLALAVCLGTASVSLTTAQPLNVPAPSPQQTIKQAFALSEINIEYSRPSAKGRTVFGELVPFGKIWRTGANASTKISFGEDVKVEGASVPSGTYALYTIPGKDSWEIMLYKDLKLGGNVSDYNKENEVARFVVKTFKTNDKHETFTIFVSDITSNTAIIQLLWENTRVSFRVTADIDEKVMQNIQAAMTGEKPPYFQAANYYYENNKDLNKAAEWVDKAIEQNQKAYWMHLLKARIQTRQNDKAGAIATADKVITLAKEAKNDDYVKMAEQIKAQNKK